MTIAPTPRFDELSPEESRRALAGLRPGLPVFCVDSRRPVGKVEGVLQQPSARDAKLLVRSGRLRSIVRLVPASDIDSVGPDRVVLGLERWQFEAKPLYLPDEEVQQAVYDALKAVGPLRYTALRQVEVEVRNGVARLSGHVPTELHRQEAVQVAAAPPGVVKVEDELMTDERLVRAVAVAMLPHPELQPSKITISANLGTVILEGELDSPREVELAAIVAASIPGVTNVENRLRVRRPGAVRAQAGDWSPSGRGGGMVVLVPAERPLWRYAGELEVDPRDLSGIARRQVVK
jgi:osmotically-inducible protein OsmY